MGVVIHRMLKRVYAIRNPEGTAPIDVVDTYDIFVKRLSLFVPARNVDRHRKFVKHRVILYC